MQVQPVQTMASPEVCAPSEPGNYFNSPRKQEDSGEKFDQTFPVNKELFGRYEQLILILIMLTL